MSDLSCKFKCLVHALAVKCSYGKADDGGECGIRTHGTVKPYTGFRIRGPEGTVVVHESGFPLGLTGVDQGWGKCGGRNSGSPSQPSKCGVFLSWDRTPAPFVPTSDRIGGQSKCSGRGLKYRLRSLARLPFQAAIESASRGATSRAICADILASAVRRSNAVCRFSQNCADVSK